MRSEMTPTEKEQVAQINWEVTEKICKALNLNVIDVIEQYQTEASFILGAIQSIVIKESEKAGK